MLLNSATGVVANKASGSGNSGGRAELEPESSPLLAGLELAGISGAFPFGVGSVSKIDPFRLGPDRLLTFMLNTPG